MNGVSLKISFISNKHLCPDLLKPASEDADDEPIAPNNRSLSFLGRRDSPVQKFSRNFLLYCME